MNRVTWGPLRKPLEGRFSWIQRVTTAYLVLAAIYDIKHRPEAAEQTIQKAISIDPDCYEANVLLSKLLIEAGRFDEAEKAARTAVVIQP